MLQDVAGMRHPVHVFGKSLPRSVLLSFEALTMVFQLEDLEICSTSRKKHQGTNGSLQAIGISSSKQPSLQAEILESRRVW